MEESLGELFRTLTAYAPADIFKWALANEEAAETRAMFAIY